MRYASMRMSAAPAVLALLALGVASVEAQDRPPPADPRGQLILRGALEGAVMAVPSASMNLEMSRLEQDFARLTLELSRLSANPVGWLDPILTTPPRVFTNADVVFTPLLGRLQQVEGCPREELQLRQTALMALTRDEGVAIEVVEEILRGTEPCDQALRPVAVALLGQWGSPRAITALIRILREPREGEENVRQVAIATLLRVEETRAVEALMQTALEDPSSQVRNTAFMQLALSEDPRARTMVRQVITNGDLPVETQILAIRSLTRNAGDEDVRLLQEVYRQSVERSVREAILSSLAVNGTENVEFLVQVAREDPDDRLRRLAVAFLSRSDDPRAQAVLRDIARGRP